MKKFLILSLSLLAALSIVSCKKDNNGSTVRYGVDGYTPLPTAVDIGLVVGGKTIKWASFNLGASREYEYGDYYAWGETEPYYESLDPLVWRKDKNDPGKELHYDWASYSLANGSYRKQIAYCPKNESDYWDSTVKPDGPDGELTLLPANDAATVHLGGRWRMPTSEEFQALLNLMNDEAHYVWENNHETKDKNGNIVRGVRITQKSTGNSIFFPNAGYCLDEDIGKDAGSKIYYWSSSLYTSMPYYACLLHPYSSDVPEIRANSRISGYSVRPVTEY